MSIKITLYTSVDYGEFMIQQDRKKWIILWDPEACNEGFQLDEELEDHYFDYCAANPKNLSTKDFKDIPKRGEFSTEQDAYDYIVSKFGAIS